MKISVLLNESGKQVILSPENDFEKKALAMIGPEEKVEIAVKHGQFMDKVGEHVSYDIGKCQGGYFRAFQSDGSVMFVITPKEKRESRYKDFQTTDP